MTRDYTQVRADLERVIDLSMTRAERMSAFVDTLWPRLHGAGVSWLGFYSRASGADEMVLEARRDKPACSPIGLHGACGQSCLTRTTLVVTDVKRLGAGYVACDPRDQSELVIPLLDGHGICWGVYDADSFDLGSFTEHDAEQVHELLVLAGLTTDAPLPVRVI